MSGGFDPLVPRELDLPTGAPLSDDVDVTRGEAALALDDAKIFAAPADPADVPRWRERLGEWRAGALERFGAPIRYNAPERAWASRCFAVAQIWLWDELFYDASTRRFTPERLLAHHRERFGGLDGVVLWHAYPVIGIDERNQWDFYAVDGLAEASSALREAGVAVFVDYNPWDTGTRRGGPDEVELARVIRELDADGVFLDTLKRADEGLIDALEAARPGIGLESESKMATDRIDDHALSWAQWFADSEVPGVLRAHWFEPRHMQHHIRRWHRDHAEELRSAWLNGAGVMVWEVVFGVWVGWNDRDAATLRRMLPVLRGLHGWLVEGTRTPLAVDDRAQRLFGTAFELGGSTLYTLANTGDEDATFDPHHDTESPPVTPLPKGGRFVALHPEGFTVPAQGIAGFVHLPDDADPALIAQIEALRDTLAEAGHSRDAAFPYRETRRVLAPEEAEADALDAHPAREAVSTGARRSSIVALSIAEALRAQVVEVPEGTHQLTVRYRMRETGITASAPFVDEWKPLPPRLHDLRTYETHAHIAPGVVVAAREVTAGEYGAFCAATGRTAPAGCSIEPEDEVPAVRVTLEDARAFASFIGARLPTDHEWQLAAASPAFTRLEPLCWNLTESEWVDGRTRWSVLKGGSAHVSEGSDWYFPGGAQHREFSAKYLRPGLGIDASPSIGFRVAWGPLARTCRGGGGHSQARNGGAA